MTDRRDYAGILFINDEGTENGGLIQSGKLGPNGAVDAGLSLTFDRFRQDQVLQLLHHEQGDKVGTGVVINDRPSHMVFSIDDVMRFVEETKQMTPADADTAARKHADAGHLGNRRAFFGTRNGASSLQLLDAKGRPRLEISVPSNGEPSLRFLDERGVAVRTIDAREP